MATATYPVQDPTIVEFDVRTDEMLVNMGPQHPSTHGVLRLVLRTDGEVISEVTPHLGYLHRCAEKIGENVTPIQFIPYTDRMDYLAGMNMNLGYSLAVEKLCGMKIPEKAQVIRVIIAELNRIASHLVGMGAYGLDLGTFSPFLYAFREREMILDLFEEVCGARLTYSYITIGGAHDDLPDGWVGRCQEFLDYLKPRIEEYHTLLTRNAIFVQRTAGIGIMSKEMALSYGCSGPMLRGSLNRDLGDPEWDLREIEPILLTASNTSSRRSSHLSPKRPRKPCSAIAGTVFTSACWKSSRASSSSSRDSSVTPRPPAPIASSCPSTCTPAKPTSKPNAPAAKWASTSSATP